MATLNPGALVPVSLLPAIRTYTLRPGVLVPAATSTHPAPAPIQEYWSTSS